MLPALQKLSPERSGRRDNKRPAAGAKGKVGPSQKPVLDYYLTCETHPQMMKKKKKKTKKVLIHSIHLHSPSLPRYSRDLHDVCCFHSQPATLEELDDQASSPPCGLTNLRALCQCLSSPEATTPLHSLALHSLASHEVLRRRA